MLILFASIRSVPNILSQLVLTGLKQWLQLDHLVLTLPGVHFLGFLGGFVRVLTRCMQVRVIHPLVSSLKALMFFLKEEKGVTLLLHGVKMVVSVVRSLQYIYIYIYISLGPS